MEKVKIFLLPYLCSPCNSHYVKFNVSDGVGLNIFTKITEEEKIAIENEGDPIDAPPGPYTIQPDVPGKKYH